jgi:tRNA pseudouridine13 synthase
MKVKQRPDDFHVEELTDVTPGEQGPIALYRLEKRGWTTPDAIQAIRRRWQLDLGRLSYGGLKDRHAHTIQYLSIFRGPRRNFTHHEIHLTYLGQVQAPYASTSIRANRFRLTLRAFKEDEIPAAVQALEEVRHDGVPNYFDDQRFGSVTTSRAGSVSDGTNTSDGEFIARLLVRGQYEDALRLALTAPYEFDRKEAKKEKAILRQHWGDWPTAKDRLPRGHARSLVDYLVHHPTDFRGTLARMRPELRGLYLSAYQSYLWNRMLARHIERSLRPEQIVRVPLRLGEVPMPRGLDDTQLAALTAATLPLPTARLHLDPADPRLPLIQEVLAEEALELSQLKVKGVREMFFSKGDRGVLCVPANLTFESADDELNAGKKKLLLSFELPRGSYATLVVKRITPRDQTAEPGA